MRQLVLTCALCAGTLIIGHRSASAHVGVQPGQVPADSYTKLTFSVPHGCDGSSTTRLRVSIPEGVVSVKPQVVAGWAIETITDTYATPVMLHGSPVTTGVVEVSWEGDPLPDAYLQEFGMSVHVPAAEGASLMFPVIQECEEGETAWIEEMVEGEEEPEHPAPVVALLAAAEAGVTTNMPTPPAEPTEHAHDESEPHVDDYGFSFMTGAAFVMGAAGLILGAAALMAVRAARP